MNTRQEWTRRGFHASCIGLAVASSARANWDQWRGPSRNGQVDARFPWPRHLSADSLELLWEQPLEPSYSGPIVRDDVVYVTETINKQSERVTAFDVASGNSRWQADWPGAMRVPFFAATNGSWIRSTPAVADNQLFVAGMRDVLVCLDATTGEEIWRNDFVETQSAPLPTFGFVSSPLIDGNHVFVQAGGGLLKVDRSTGQVVWRQLADGGGMNGSAFSSPVLHDLLGQRQLLVQTRQELVGVSPHTGEQLWSTPVPAYRGMNILPPTVHQDTVFTSTYRNGSFCYQLSQDSSNQIRVHEKWKNRVQGYMSSPLVFDDHVYLHLANGRLTCLQLSDGSQKWSSRPYGKYWSSVAQGDKMLALDERGDLLLVNPNPQQFDLLGTAKVADNAWAHLAIDRDLLFVRDLRKLRVLRWKA